MATIPGTEQPNTIEEFVIFIRRRRKSLKLSQSDLAGLCGLTKEGLSRIERGEVEPKLGTVLKLVKILNGQIEVRWK
ncbi:MAG TPA: helix-turn-helix transcriptional regulator [Oligoflexus sp.]|uniref:helix-turn-helix domain-containing protein n=1 Tax=Oligoflexus sp. TaxID=1971216 RepID=UPI002D808607|nr:helix-turn-helix transcriptional regulator [Oligoflexus sp.]HET9239049.1 helix-turn-helix transcriptional regulator [Oligoflexus sp.]